MEDFFAILNFMRIYELNFKSLKIKIAKNAKYIEP